MTLLRRFAVLLPLLVLPADPAAATATLTCDIADGNLTADLMGNVGTSDVTYIQVTNGAITLKAVRGKHDAVEFKIEGGHLIQQWALEKELRLGLQPEAKNGVSIYLAIIAQKARSKGDTEKYEGRYVLKVSSSKGASELKGKLKSCEIG